MKEKIQEVVNYFKNKMLVGDFEITEIKQHTLVVIIDDYEFTLWIGNFTEYPKTVKNYYGEYNFMMLDLTDEESIKLCEILKTPIMEYRKNTLIAQKKAELEKLINETE